MIRCLMTFAAPTVLPTLEVDSMQVLSNRFSAETELSNAQCVGKCCFKSSNVEISRSRSGAYTRACCKRRCVGSDLHHSDARARTHATSSADNDKHTPQKEKKRKAETRTTSDGFSDFLIKIIHFRTTYK